jgi:hypothetical protein
MKQGFGPVFLFSAAQKNYPAKRGVLFIANGWQSPVLPLT